MSHAECDKCLKKLCCNFNQQLFEVFLQWEKVRYTETEQCWCKLLINGGGVGGGSLGGVLYRVTTLVTLKNMTLTLAILSDFQWPTSTSDGAIAPTAYHYNYSHVQDSCSSKLPLGLTPPSLNSTKHKVSRAGIHKYHMDCAKLRGLTASNNDNTLSIIINSMIYWENTVTC